MSRDRLEAFSDAVLAVVITIMVLNLRPPAGHDFTDLRPLLPKLAIYLLSFVFVAIYWNNHHHLFQVVERISGAVLWANALLLFWLSLTPVAAAWLGPHLGDTAPTATYGVVLLGSAIAYGILVRTLVAAQPPGSPLERAVGRDRKGNLSIVAYVVAIALSPVVPWLSLAFYFAVAAVWLIPDRRIERVLPRDENVDQPEGRVT
jgi:TMEM175 potassium channel family protein